MYSKSDILENSRGDRWDLLLRTQAQEAEDLSKHLQKKKNNSDVKKTPSVVFLPCGGWFVVFCVFNTSFTMLNDIHKPTDKRKHVNE